jgi:hypothetical protein
LVNVQDDFGTILALSEATSLFPFELDRTELPLLELRDVIKFSSQLPSKADLIMQFDQFVQLARSTKADLGSFSMHLAASYDKIISMNRHTLRVLNVMIQDEEKQSSLSKAWGAITGYKGIISEADVVRHYLHHADTVEAQTDALILQGEHLLIQLQSLDSMLDLLRETANRDIAELTESKDELFSSLWTYLGGNSADKKRIAKNIAVAEKLKETRSAAANLVRRTLEELRRIKNGMIDVTARVAGPRHRGQMDRHEIEEHIMYVSDGLERLYARRIEGKTRENQGRAAVLGYVNNVYDRLEIAGPKYSMMALADKKKRA